MRRVAILVLAVAPAVFARGPEAPAPLAAPAPRIDQYVEQRLRAQLVRGAGLVIVENGKVTHSRAFGEARRGVAMTVDTPVVIGSLSKAFTATAVLQLVDEKKVELDQPVRRYLRDFKLADESAAAKLTVRQLLNQTSGLPGDAPRATKGDPTLADHVHALASTHLVAAPGSRHIYSSPNYQILGLLVERVSGLSFADYVRARIFTPLGMTRSFVDVASAKGSGLAPGHNIWFGKTLPSSYRHEPDRLPTASIITTASDLGRFVNSHLGIGPQILSPESLRIAHQGVAKQGSFKYAMGWREGETAGVKSFWHGGALPSYRGAVVMLPESKRGVIILTNSTSMFVDHTREIATGIVALLHDRQPSIPRRSLRKIYQWIAILALIIGVAHIRGLFKILDAGPKGKSLPKVVVLDLIVPLAVFAFLPAMTSISWRGMYEAMPDVTLFLVILLSSSIIAGAVRLLRSRKGNVMSASWRPSGRHEA